MPRYFFDVMDGQLIRDTEGTVCWTDDDMRNQAIATAGGILKDLAHKFPRGLEWHMHVRDERDETVLKIRFSIDERSQASHGTAPEPPPRK
jgi:hypothetical protein